MPYKITDIKDLDPTILAKIQGMGMKTVDDLVDRTDTPQERSAMAKELGLAAPALTEIINRADLARLNGVGKETANLLEEGGVDSCKELARRIPQNLYDKLKTMNDEKKIAHRAPTLAQCESFINQAKEIVAASKKA